MKMEYKPKNQFSNFSFSWDDNYESGDDEDVTTCERGNFVSFIANSADSMAYASGDDSDNEGWYADINWKGLYERECMRSDGYICTITNLRNQITESSEEFSSCSSKGSSDDVEALRREFDLLKQELEE